MIQERIAIYGATGRLGQLVTGELISRAARLRLGGRDERKLAMIASATPDCDWKAAAVDDPVALDELLSGCRVVVNAAGSTSALGERLVAAALRAGVHYIDPSGEQPFIRDIFDKHGPAAEERGVALVPAFGFDYAIGDCLARLVAHPHQPAREVAVAYAIEGAEVSGHSLQFAAERPGGGEVFYESGRWMPAQTGIYRRTVAFPAPFGRLPVARYGAGEIITVPRHTRTDTVTTLITVRSLVPHPALVPVFPYLRPLVAFVRRTPARRLLGLPLKLRKFSPTQSNAPPQPPRFAIVVLVQSHDGTHHRGVVEGGDFHLVTAATLAYGASLLAAPGFGQRGALPPAVAARPEALFEELGRLGVTCRVDG